MALLLIIIVVGVHIPSMMHATEAMAKMMETSMIVKDTAIAMGAIVIANEATHQLI